MAKDERTELLEQSVLPILLGNGPRAHLLAFRLYLRYGVTSFAGGSRRTLWDLLNPFCDFYRLFLGENGRLLKEQLLSLAEEYEETLFVLIPTTKEMLDLIHPHVSELENRFILSEPRTVTEKLPFQANRTLEF